MCTLLWWVGQTAPSFSCSMAQQLLCAPLRQEAHPPDPGFSVHAEGRLTIMWPAGQGVKRGGVGRGWVGGGGWGGSNVLASWWLARWVGPARCIVRRRTTATAPSSGLHTNNHQQNCRKARTAGLCLELHRLPALASSCNASCNAQNSSLPAAPERTAGLCLEPRQLHALRLPEVVEEKQHLSTPKARAHRRSLSGTRCRTRSTCRCPPPAPQRARACVCMAAAA